MKNTNKIFVSMFSLLLLSCSLESNSKNTLLNLDNQNKISVNNINNQPNSKNAKWTVMVYIAGDNDLEEYVVKDIENELGIIGSTDNIQVTALADRIPGYDKSRDDWTSSKIFHITKNIKADSKSAVADWGERNSGDPKTLTDFVTWSKTNYPAEKYALFMWGHGWNWHQGYTMEDKTSKDSLDPDEMKQLIPKLGQIDFIAYDGCNMASIEVEALWNNHAKAIVHSQEYVGWDGIEYDTVLKKLNENPQINAEQLAVITSKSASVNQEKTGSAVVLDSRWNNLQKSVDEFAIALKNGLSKYRKNYEIAFKATQSFVDAPDDKDLYDLAFQINKNVNEPIIKSKSQKLMSSVKAVVLDEWHTNEYPRAHGITISKVPADDENKKFYKTIDFSKNTNWDEFLDAYKE